MIINGKQVISYLLAVAVLSLVGLIILIGWQQNHAGNVIGVVYVEGTITQGGTRQFFGDSTTYFRELRRAAQDPRLKALILRIDSPGGSSAASQELYNITKAISDRGIPVVVSMADVAASGGYYLAAAGDHIIANGTTITGSIGVIMEFSNLSQLYERLGIDQEIIKAGEFKDAGRPQRSLTPEEEQLFLEVVNDSWDQFVDDVAAGRNLPRHQVEAIADGRIFTGRQALDLGLVDELGGFDLAVERAKALGGIDGTAKLESYRERKSLWEQITSLNLRADLTQLIEDITYPQIRLRY